MKDMKKVVSKINRRSLVNNTQKVLLAMLTADTEWVSRRALDARVPSATSRLRDLRTEEFGGWKIEVKTAPELNRRGDSHTTFYRLVPTSITRERLTRVFEGVVLSS